MGTQAVKFIAETKDGFTVGGYGVVWGGQDVTREFFTPETDFWFDRLTETPMVLYNHGQDETVKRVVVGKVTARRVDDMGLWIEAQITAAKKYANAIRPLVEKGVLGWSSGAIGHLVDRTKHADGRTQITSWPVAEWSLTPTPAEPRTIGVRAIKSLGISLPDVDDYEVEDGTKAHESDIESKPYRIEKQGNQYVVLGPTGKPMGRHKTRSAALRQQRALYASEGKSSPMPDLPDSAYAYIEPGGALDDEQKTVPRTHRHVEHHDESGALDLDAVKVFLEDAEPNSPAVAHMMRHALEDVLGMKAAPAEGATVSILTGIFKLSRLAPQIAEHDAFRKGLKQDTHEGAFLVAEDLGALKAILAELTQVVTKSEEIERGVDGAAIVQMYRTAFDLIDLEEVA